MTNEIRWEEDSEIKYVFNLMNCDSIHASVFLNCNDEWTAKLHSGQVYSYKTRKEAFDEIEADSGMLITNYIGFDAKLSRPRRRR